MLSKGQKVNGRYEIIKNIGEGGMANVYLATDTILDRLVAVKVLRGDLSEDEKFIRRFQREAMSASNLNHPNIVEVYDVGEEDGSHYIVMEFVEGKTLKQLISKRGALTIPEVIDIMSQLTDGLSHAHDAYIIHRDIKPQNILILDNGLVKITDFGIAMAINATQLTQTNSVMGSVHYLPPEQASGKGSTIKSDIYSLGILMYELLTGSVPFKGDNAVEIALKHMKEKMPSVRKQNPNIPQSVENIIIKATAKNPKNRYDSAREMYEDLATCLNKENEKRYVFPYPENDLEDTLVLNDLKKDIGKEIKEEPKEEVMIKEIEEPLEEIHEDKKRNRLILILASIFIGLLIIASLALFVVPKLMEAKEVTIPDVSGLTDAEAEAKLKELGLEVALEVKKEASDIVEEGLVIRTDPSKNRKVREGTVITLIMSTGTNFYIMEDFTTENKNYLEVKAILENVHKLHVLVEKKDVENIDDYKNKENIIIEQSPKPGTKLVEDDTVTLYIPNIVERYPDMVSEGWTLEDAKLFEKKYKIILDIVYEERDDIEPGLIIKQSRTAGSTIIEGATLKVTVSIESPVNPLLP